MSAAAAIAVAVATTLAAQSRPDFSGSWVVDVEKTMAAQGRSVGMSGSGPSFTITQDANALVITTPGGEKITYRFDGSKVTNPVLPAATRRGASPTSDLPSPGTQEIYASVWQSSKLVTTKSGRGANGPTLATETRWLEGEWMVTETTRKTPSGETTSRMYWKRVKRPA